MAISSFDQHFLSSTLTVYTIYTPTLYKLILEHLHISLSLQFLRIDPIMIDKSKKV